MSSKLGKTLESALYDYLTDLGMDWMNKNQEECKRLEEIHGKIMEKTNDDTTVEELLNELSCRLGEKKEDFYLYGIRDGIQIAKLFFKITAE